MKGVRRETKKLDPDHVEARHRHTSYVNASYLIFTGDEQRNSPVSPARQRHCLADRMSDIRSHVMRYGSRGFRTTKAEYEAQKVNDARSGAAQVARKKDPLRSSARDSRLTRIASGSPSLKVANRKYHMLTMKVIIVHASR